MSASIEPEPTGPEREAIEAVLGEDDGPALGGWALAALGEGVEQEEPIP